MKIGKGKVENEVEDKWQSHYPWQFFRVDFIKHGAKSDGDDSVKHRPHRPKDPAWWRPGGLEEGAVPIVGGGVHFYILP